MASATSASAGHVLDEGVNLVVGSRTVFYHFACEVQRLASHRMVGIHGDAVGLYGYDARHEAMLLWIHECDDGAGIDVLCVKLAVDLEHLTLQFMDSFCQIIAESLCWCQGKVERCAFFQMQHMLLQGIERNAESADKLKWMLTRGLLFKRTFAVFHRIELIVNG